jgi:hypothetical protein
MQLEKSGRTAAPSRRLHAGRRSDSRQVPQNFPGQRLEPGFGDVVLPSTRHQKFNTTHIVTSGIAGTMLMGRTPGLQQGTVSRIAFAWILTLPVTIGIAAALF